MNIDITLSMHVLIDDRLKIKSITVLCPRKCTHLLTCVSVSDTQTEPNVYHIYFLSHISLFGER